MLPLTADPPTLADVIHSAATVQQTLIRVFQYIDGVPNQGQLFEALIIAALWEPRHCAAGFLGAWTSTRADS